MVQAYLGKPDYTNAMNRALATRLAYDNARGRGGGVRVGGGGRGGSASIRTPGPQAAPMGSPEQRRQYREQMIAEDAELMALEQGEADIAATEAGTAQTQKSTNLMGVESPEDIESKQLSNKMKKEKIRDAQVDRTQTVLDNALQWVPQVTQESYADMYDWVGESDGAAQGLLLPPEKIEAMTPLEWKVHHSKLEGVFSPNAKKLKKAADAQIKIDKQAEKDQAAAHKEYIRVQGVIDRASSTGSLPEADYEKLPSAVKAFLKGKDRTEYIGLLEEYAQQLVDKHGFEPEPRGEEPPPVGDNPLDKATAQQFLQAAGGDVELARQNAAAEGYTF